jgi:hypothetical protein
MPRKEVPMIIHPALVAAYMADRERELQRTTRLRRRPRTSGRSR